MRKSLESGRIYEPNYYLFWSVYPRAHDPAAAPKDAPNEVTGCRVRNSKDVPVLWVDYISTKGVLRGVRQVSYKGSVFGYTQLNRHSQRMGRPAQRRASFKKSRFYVKNSSGKDYACDVLGRTITK
jgi:hypothetical protein